MSKNTYEFRTDISGKNGNIGNNWGSISKIEINYNKLDIDNIIYKSKDMFNSLENCSGYYDIDEIKSIKKSSKQLWGATLICIALGALFFIVQDIIYRCVGEGILAIFLLWFTMIGFRVSTIKITFNSSKCIHIPVKPFVDVVSKDYREEINEFINTINDNIKVIKNK